MRKYSFDVVFNEIKWAIKKEKQKDVAEALGISASAVSDAKKRGVIPEAWFDTIELEYGISKEVILAEVAKRLASPSSTINQTGVGSAQAIQHATVENAVVNQAPAGPPSVDHAGGGQFSRQLFAEIAEWLEGMEKTRPGFNAWFAVEFRNRFPELEQWQRDHKGV